MQKFNVKYNHSPLGGNNGENNVKAQNRKGRDSSLGKQAQFMHV